MKRAPLWQFSVTTSLAAEEAVAEQLATFFGLHPSIYTDAATGWSTVTVYAAQGAGRLAGRVDAAALRRGLREKLRDLAASGLRTDPGRVTVAKLPHRNWAESWKRHFQPLEIGGALLLTPSWRKRRPRPGQAVVVLDPGLSFGTGHHPTTEFCLRQLVARRAPGRRQSFLDLGTGSGILAIAAAKLGYALVRAVDFDPDAIRVARANAAQNGVARRLRIVRGDVTRFPIRSRERHDVVCANLISTLLLAERERIIHRVNDGGVLVLAGILAREFAEVRRAYEAAGLRLIASRRVKEWRSGAFVLPSDP